MDLFIFILKWAKSKCKFQTLLLSWISSLLTLFIAKIQIQCTDLRTCICNLLVTVLRSQVLAELRHVFIYQFTCFSHRLRPGRENLFFCTVGHKQYRGTSSPLLKRAQYMAIKSCNSFLGKRRALNSWYTFKCLLTWLSPWTVVFLWVHLLMGESLSHCLQPPVTLLQIPDTLLPHPYHILKGKDLPQLLQAKITWVSLNNLVVQVKPVPLGFNSSKTCSIQSFHNSLTTSAGGVMFYL